MRPNISLGDTLAGLHGALGAVMALLHRQRHLGHVPGQVCSSRPRVGSVTRTCECRLCVGSVGRSKGPDEMWQLPQQAHVRFCNGKCCAEHFVGLHMLY